MRRPIAGRIVLALLLAAGPAVASPLLEVELRGGSTMRARRAERADDGWRLVLESGIRLTLPDSKVVAVRPLPDEPPAEERLPGLRIDRAGGADAGARADSPPRASGDGDPGALLSAVAELRAARRLGEAEALLRGELVRSPGDALRLVLLGRVLADADRFREALEPLRLADVAGDDRLRRERDLAWAESLSRLDRVDEALRVLERTPEDASGRVQELRSALRRDLDGSAGLVRRTTGRFALHLPEGAERTDLSGLLDGLEAAWEELERALGGAPTESVVVVVHPGTDFWETTGMGRQIAGLYDGKVRVPAGRLDPPSPRLAAVLRHELAHAFVDAITGGRADAAWQEGIAEHFERSALVPALERRLAADFRASRWPPAYDHPTAHSRLEWFLSRWGEAGLRDLLRAWARHGGIDEALLRVTGLRQSELERAWGRALVEKWER